MLRRLRVINYKCLDDFELDLKGTVLLLGGNGAGKTAVLDVVFGLRKLLAAEAKITHRADVPDGLDRVGACTRCPSGQ